MEFSEGGIPELRQHTPLSAFDRDLKRIKLHLEHKQNLIRVAIGAGAAFGSLLVAIGVLAALDVVSWRIAGITVGASAMLVGLARWLINASVHRRHLAAAKRLQPLNADGVDLLCALAEHHAGLQVELDIWNVLTDELSVNELEIAQKWSNEQYTDQKKRKL